MITFRQKGNFNNTEKFLKKDVVSNYMSILSRYAQEGVDVLSRATPIDTGNTANCWSYRIKRYPGSVVIYWLNSNITTDGVPVAVLLQYGHATRNGGFVQGQDYINPAIRPIFDKIANEAWKEVIR